MSKYRIVKNGLNQFIVEEYALVNAFTGGQDWQNLFKDYPDYGIFDSFEKAKEKLESHKKMFSEWEEKGRLLSQKEVVYEESA